MENNFHKAYKEVLEILKYMPKEEADKIPKELILTFETKMDKNYQFKIDVNKGIEEQNLLEETKDILANLFRDYWATETQREKIIQKEKYDRQKLEEQKRIKYDPNNIFSKNNEDQPDEKEEMSLIVQKDRWYEKIINFIKRFLKIS